MSTLPSAPPFEAPFGTPTLTLGVNNNVRRVKLGGMTALWILSIVIYFLGSSRIASNERKGQSSSLLLKFLTTGSILTFFLPIMLQIVSYSPHFFCLVRQ